MPHHEAGSDAADLITEFDDLVTDVIGAAGENHVGVDQVVHRDFPRPVAARADLKHGAVAFHDRKVIPGARGCWYGRGQILTWRKWWNSLSQLNGPFLVGQCLEHEILAVPEPLHEARRVGIGGRNLVRGGLREANVEPAAGDAIDVSDLFGDPAAESGADDGDAIEAIFFQESLVEDRQDSDVVEPAHGFRMTAPGCHGAISRYLAASPAQNGDAG